MAGRRVEHCSGDVGRRPRLGTVDSSFSGSQLLRVLADTWANADVPGAGADLLHTHHDRIVVVGRSIVAARVTPAARSNGRPLPCLRCRGAPGRSPALTNNTRGVGRAS